MTNETKDFEERIIEMESAFNDERAKVARSMELYGGSFEKALGIALSNADYINAVKIKNSFYGEWQKHLKFSESLEEKKQCQTG